MDWLLGQSEMEAECSMVVGPGLEGLVRMKQTDGETFHRFVFGLLSSDQFTLCSQPCLNITKFFSQPALNILLSACFKYFSLSQL